MKRLFLLLSLALIALGWILAANVWVSATITDQDRLISATGLELYPQIPFILGIWVLGLSISRYIKELFGKFLLSAVTFMVFAAAFPIWFDSAASNLATLSPQIEKWTGISGWLEQESLLSNAFFSQVLSEAFIVALVAGLASTITFYWVPTSSSSGKQLVTRVDRLPKW